MINVDFGLKINYNLSSVYCYVKTYAMLYKRFHLCSTLFQPLLES